MALAIVALGLVATGSSAGAAPAVPKLSFSYSAYCYGNGSPYDNINVVLTGGAPNTRYEIDYVQSVAPATGGNYGFGLLQPTDSSGAISEPFYAYAQATANDITWQLFLTADDGSGSYEDTGSAIESGTLAPPPAGLTCTGGSVPALPPVPTGLKIKTSVSNYYLDNLPAANAYVVLNIAVTNANGKPASGAAVRVSNMNPAASSFNASSQGKLSLVESVDLTQLAPFLTVTATSTSGAGASTSQLLYTATEQVTCSFSGIHDPVLSELEALLPDPSPTIPAGSIIGFIHEYGFSSLHTSIETYEIDVPGATRFYGAVTTLTAPHHTNTYTVFSTRQPVKAPNSYIDQQETGCRAAPEVA